jgi:NAD(P)-dependent dehydrogenase (short-subunit alcohol dehydrogenase family)
MIPVSQAQDPKIPQLRANINCGFPFLATLDVDLRAGSGASARVVYSASKFAQLLGAHYWRRHLPTCTVVAVSPGLIPDTKLAQHPSLGLTMDMPDAKSVPEGKRTQI